MVMRTRIRCQRCRWEHEHDGQPEPADLERACARCAAPVSSVSTFRAPRGGGEVEVRNG